MQIEEALVKWKNEGHVIKKFSIVGYSLGPPYVVVLLITGGLLSRYVVGLLFARGVFEDIEPVNFTTFATPHLGIRHVTPGVLHTIANLLGPRLLSASGRQMFLSDRLPRPLLLRMTERGIKRPGIFVDRADSIFMRGLALFRNRIAYANIVNDRSVPFHTAAITQFDPYVDMTRVNLCYVPSYAPVILHPTHPIVPLSTPKPPPPRSWARRILFPLAIILLLPLWATFFILANLYQQFFSSRRIALHFEQHKEGVAHTALSEAVQEAFEDVVDNAALFSPTAEEPDESEYTFHDAGEETPLLNGNNHVERSTEKPVSTKRDEYKLPVSDEQVAMINGLRSINWRTFGVHINQTFHSHAAIIRRSQWRRELVEGNIVIQHWLDGQFQG